MLRIERAPMPEAGYLIVRNEVARDNRLSLMERGLLIYLLSHADGFNFSVEQYAAREKEGKQSLYKAMQNLTKFGYLERKRVHDSSTGQFTWVTFVTDVPTVPTEPVKTKRPESKNRKQASHLVTDVWEPATVGTTAQRPVAVVKIVESALDRGVSAANCAKALAILAADRDTVTNYSFNRAINGKPIKGQLAADKQKDWKTITADAIDGVLPF